MCFFLLITAFFSLASKAGLAEVSLSQKVYIDVPFSSQYIEDGALIRNVNHKAVNLLIPQLNKKFGLKLKDRGESHITVITPPEAQGWFNPDHKGVNYLISSKELHQKYFSKLQKTKFEVLCVGRQKNDKGNIVFYLVVKSVDLLNVRKEIQKELEGRAEFTGKKTFFDAKEWYPHITIGYVGSDIHGVSKGPETCVAKIDFTN